MIAHKRLDAVVKADLESLVENRVSESRTIEYKQELPGRSDEDRREFLADVSSFANTSGGDIVYGVIEERVNGAKTGIPESIPGVALIGDGEITRLENMARDGIEPRVPVLHFQKVEGFSSGVALIVRIPKSWRAPHMVIVNNSYRCFARAANGKYPRDVDQIRDAFLMSSALRERIDAFRSERLEKIRARHAVTPTQLMDGGRIVLHIVPVAGFDSPDGVELSLASVRPLPLLGGANYHRYNFDGVLVFDEMNEQSGERRCSRYAQVFRHGSIEAADTELLSQSRSQVRPNPDAIPSVYFEGKLIEWLASYLKNLLDWGVPGPLLVALSLLNVKGFKMLSQGIDMLYYSAAPIDRDDLLTSEVLVEDFEKDDLKSQAQRILRGPLDQIWQAAGYLGSPNFDKTGAWTGKL